MLGGRNEIELGGIVLSPHRRTFSGSKGTVQVEPLVMQLAAALMTNAGNIVSRAALFELCWRDAPVGDDSLNRLVAAARRSLRAVGDGGLEIETIPSVGYMLAVRPPAGTTKQIRSAADRALRDAYLSWRAALPVPDYLAIAQLKSVCAALPDDARCWGMLALMYRHAAEYGLSEDREDFVTESERAAQRALDRDPFQPEAQIALTSVVPIFGHWSEAHHRLSAILARQPGHVISTHDLAIIEMSTGRVREAKRLLDPLLAADPLAPCLGYKSTYHHWSLGDLETMDQRADRAFQLWPQHPAVWTARFWTLAFTERTSAALQMLSNEALAPPLPGSLADFLRDVLIAAADRAAGADRLAQRAFDAVAAGPAQAVNSLMALGLLGDIDRSFAVADAFYCRKGAVTVPTHSAQFAPVNEMGRRLTQVLFTPACAAMRGDSRFDRMCEGIGLSSYWQATGREPDFSSAR